MELLFNCSTDYTVPQCTIALLPIVAPKVRLRTFGDFAADWLEAERYPRIDSIEAHIEASRRIRIRDDIATRLSRACAHLPEDEFLRLVDEMTELQIKGERRVYREFLPE